MAARPKWSGWIDLDNRDMKRRFQSWIGTLRGMYEVTIEPRRSTRTNRQLAWWFSCVITPFYDFLRQQEWNVTCLLDCHDMLREKFLRVPIAIDMETGEAKGWRTQHTKELTPAEFSDFAERARAYLFDEYGIATLEPSDVVETSRSVRGIQ